MLTAALSDPGKTVRYYAALQLAGLGKELGMPALPVLKEIVAREKDDDLVERAKLGSSASTRGPWPTGDRCGAALGGKARLAVSLHA